MAKCGGPRLIKGECPTAVTLLAVIFPRPRPPCTPVRTLVFSGMLCRPSLGSKSWNCLILIGGFLIGSVLGEAGLGLEARRRVPFWSPYPMSADPSSSRGAADTSAWPRGCWRETLSLRTVPLQASRSMWYVSTRGTAPRVDFEGALFAGYAPDGGLFMPEELPRLGEETLQQWSALSYPDLVTELCALFIGPELIPRDDLNGEHPHSTSILPPLPV